MSLHKDHLVHDISKRTKGKLKKEIKEQILRTAYVKEFKFKAALFYLAGPELFICMSTNTINHIYDGEHFIKVINIFLPMAKCMS